MNYLLWKEGKLRVTASAVEKEMYPERLGEAILLEKEGTEKKCRPWLNGISEERINQRKDKGPRI